MKNLKYYGILLMSFICASLPLIGIYLYLMVIKSNYGLIIAVVMVAIGITLNKPMQTLRIKARQDIEYDEFGRSKTKGIYETLSKKERDEIDLQKTLDMERLLDTTAIKKLTKKGSKTPDKDMDSLIGLVPVKEKMMEMVARMQFESSDNPKKDITTSMSGRHMVFYGNPGTGKTTVARILTGFLYQYSYIKENKCVEVDGNFLKAGQETATKTELIIRQAFGGVLFIDEAYALKESGDGSGEQAIATLIKQMEDNRDRFVLIMAGYTDEMKDLLNANPGFSSRIKEYLVFPDYNDVEMRSIFQLMASEQNFVVDGEAYDVFDERIKKERQLKSFGNARTVRNILDETIDRHAYNYVKGHLQSNDKYKICSCDIRKNVKKLEV